MEARTRDVWVFIETIEDGSAKSAGLELLTPGRTLAQGRGGRLTAVVVGEHVDQAVEAAGARGADEIIVVDAPIYRAYATETYTKALCALVEKYGPETLLMGATNNGRDLAPRVSAQLETGLAADCTALSLDGESGCVVWTRPAYSGKRMTDIICPDRRPQMGTVRPGVFKKPPLGEDRAEIVREEIAADPREVRLQVVKLIQDLEADQVDLEGAEIIVSGGGGVGGPEGFAPVRELAQALGAEVGASRFAVDSGWISHSHQVGQTGKKVTPRVYIACGISGAIQHLAGMRGAECIVAVNSDPKAPIFDIADYGVVGDLFQVLPVLTEEIKKARA